MEEDRSIITVVGKDGVGIIARITAYLYENNVNIRDITQTIVAGFFNMMMIVEISNSQKPFADLSSELEKLGIEIGVQIKFQRENIFKSMQRI